MNDDRNNELFAKYKALGEREKNVVFGGRLGMYRYFDMNNIVDEALKCAARELP
jgi:UDP-galactopyranose mutase